MFLSQSHTFRITRQAQHSFELAMEQSRRCYDRARDLPRLLPQLLLTPPGQWPKQRDLIALLNRAAARERRLGATGSPRYSLIRHAALVRALRLEMQPRK